MYHIAFYVPREHSDKVKESMFQAGAGSIGHYDKCSFEYNGIGQFRPLPGSEPFIGSEGKVEQVQEVKVEMVCSKEHIAEAVKALKNSHPYETPAYYVIETVSF